jgi:hypothetical protein
LENSLLPRVGFAGRPQTNGNVEALHRTILKECWRPSFARYLYPRYTGLRRELETYLRYYNFDRVHLGRPTRGRIPADIIYGARKDGGEMSRACRHISESVQLRRPASLANSGKKIGTTLVPRGASPDTSSKRKPRFFCGAFRGVSDGTRTRDRLDHNQADSGHVRWDSAL